MRKHDALIAMTKKTGLYGYTMLLCFRACIAGLFGGESCVRCGAQSGVFPLCPSCRKLFLQTALPVGKNASVARCRICGKALLSEHDYCSACRAEPILKHVDGAFPLQTYRLWKKSLLFAWKMQDRRTLSPLFAQMFYTAYTELCAATEETLPVVPVPPRPGKIRERGWDQIAELCSFLRRGWGVPVLPVLERRTRIQQKKLGRAERFGKSEQAYHLVAEKRLHALAPAVPPRVVLVDDVLTTGATLEQCAIQLKQWGVHYVFAMPLFIVA